MRELLATAAPECGNTRGPDRTPIRAVTAVAERTACSIEGCEKPEAGRRGWCEIHYYRWRVHGSADWVPPVRPSVCVVEGCGVGGKLRRGMCRKHYDRLTKYGDPLARPPASRWEWRGWSIEERFWAWVDTGGANGCWLWTGMLSTSGYGQFGKRIAAHRFAYEFAVGPIPNGLQLDHLCRVRNCVNPSHLEPVDPWENWRRGESPAAVNRRKTHCKRGHAFDEANTAWALNARGKAYRWCRACNRERKK